MKFKKVILIWAIFLVLGNVSAECPGYLRILDIPDTKVGDRVGIIIDVAIPSSLGVRNIDLELRDPQDNTIILKRLRLDSEINIIDTRLNITNTFITGNYIVTARIKVLDAENMTTMICSDSDVEMFYISTNRTSYTGVELELKPLDRYTRYTYSVVRNISYGDATIPMNLTLRNIPTQFPIRIEDFNFSLLGDDSEVVLSPDIPMYSYGAMKKIQSQLNALIYDLDACQKDKEEAQEEIIQTNRQILREISTIETTCMRSEGKDISGNIIVNISGITYTCIPDEKYLQLTLQQKENEQELDECKDWFKKFWNWRIFNIFIGFIFSISLLWAIAYFRKGWREA